MELTRRSVLAGASALGGAGAIWVAVAEPLSNTYQTSVHVSLGPERSRPASVELTLRNTDADEMVLDESFGLTGADSFRREGILSKDTNYVATVKTDRLSASEGFWTYGHGYSVYFAIRPDHIEPYAGHSD